MEVEFTTVGERGQAVIPKTIRKKMPVVKGTLFTIVMVDKDTLLMKRVDKKKILDEFRDVRTSIKKKFSEAEFLEEVKKARHG